MESHDPDFKSIDAYDYERVKDFNVFSKRSTKKKLIPVKEKAY